MNKEKLNNLYKQLKDNLSVILLVPTILGGIWQLLELSSISASFIRFFSFTQLIADGLLILFVLTIFFISYRFTGIQFNNDTFKLNSENPPPFWYGITLISIVLILIILLFPEFKGFYEKKNHSIPEIAIMIPVITMLFASTILGIISLTEKLINIKANTIKKLISNKWIRGITQLLFRITIILLFFWFLKFILIDLNPHFSNFRSHLLFPDKLLNKEILDKKIINEQKLKFLPKLIYYNDKYFFYEILDEQKNKKILIVDFAELIYK